MRLHPIAPSELSREQWLLYRDMRAGIEGSFKGFTAINENGALLGPWNPWLHYPKFGEPAWALVRALSASPTLPKPIREVAILVTSAKFKAAYETYAHVRVAQLGGLSDDKIATILAGQRPDDLSREESIAYDAASALVSGGVLPPSSYQEAVQAFGEQGAAELISLVGLYCMVAVILNGFDAPLPEGESVGPPRMHEEAETGRPSADLSTSHQLY
jgi:alkylhydroperoxidase family enzyme